MTSKSIEAGAPALGALSGLLLADHHGLPTWFVLLAISGSLLFGIISAAARPRAEAARAEARRMAKSNAGALWILACASVWIGDLALPGAMMTALTLGLLGQRALEAIEKRWLSSMGGGDGTL